MKVIKKDNTYLKIKKLEEEVKFLAEFCQELSTYIEKIEEKAVELEEQIKRYKELTIDQLDAVEKALKIIEEKV